MVFALVQNCAFLQQLFQLLGAAMRKAMLLSEQLPLLHHSSAELQANREHKAMLCANVSHQCVATNMLKTGARSSLPRKHS